MKPVIGHLLKTGECFESASKKMTKQIRHIDDKVKTLIYKKPGTKDFFIHKGRRYYCEVIGCVEQRFGWYHGVWLHPERKATIDRRVMWWQFTYLVQILEN